MPTTELADETVFLIHGTWSNRATEIPGWWQPGSDFCSRLDRALESKGAPVRCWADVKLILGNRPRIFAWTGANRESDRLAAGDALRDTLGWFEKTQIHYHLVAHSHGGNVVLHALEGLSRDPKYLRTVTFLGTPFLNFGVRREFKLLLTRRLPLSVDLLALVLSCWMVVASRFHGLAVVCTLVLGLATFLEFWRLVGLEPLEKKKRSSLYGSGRPYVFAFASDEAVGGLIHTVSAMSQPRKFIGQFMERDAGCGFAVPPTEPYNRYRFVETWPVLTLKNSDFKFRATTTRGLFGLPLGLFMLLVAICALIPETLILVAHWLPRAASAVQSKALRWLLEQPGASVAGRVIRDSAVGADQGPLVGISHLPPGVEHLQPISSDLENRMSAVARQFTGALGEVFHAGLTRSAEEALKQNVFANLSDPSLAHSQYYQEQEIIEHVAACIAGAYQAVNSLPCS